jgi:hypothetical protein
MTENQTIPDLFLGYDEVRVIRGKVLESSCETLEAESCGVAMRFSVISSSDYEILSVPDWVTLAPFSKDLLSDVYCEVTENSSEAPREAEILFRNEDGCTFTFKIHQNGSLKADDWVHREFYHRSLIICHTMQGCGYSDNLHPLLYSFIDDPSDKESILMIYYPGGSERSMCFNGVEKMIDMYQFSSTPSGILDGREYIGLFVIDRDDIVRMVAETERDHAVRTGIELTSTATTDGLLNVDATVYCKKEGAYRLCVFLVEDNIVAWQNGKGNDYLHRNVAKLAVTDPCGDSFTVSEANSVQKFSFHAAIPASCRRENLKIIAYTLYEYGPPAFIHYPEESGLEYYTWKYEGSIVDNSVTVNVGTYNPLRLEDKKSGGNEDIHTGDSITFN